MCMSNMSFRADDDRFIFLSLSLVGDHRSLLWTLHSRKFQATRTAAHQSNESCSRPPDAPLSSRFHSLTVLGLESGRVPARGYKLPSRPIDFENPFRSVGYATVSTVTFQLRYTTSIGRLGIIARISTLRLPFGFRQETSHR